MKRLKRFLARLCWRASFWLSDVKPTLLVGPEEVALHERRGLERLASAIGVRLTEEASPDEDEVLRRVFNRTAGKIRERLPASIQKRERIPTARELEDWIR